MLSAIGLMDGDQHAPTQLPTAADKNRANRRTFAQQALVSLQRADTIYIVQIGTLGSRTLWFLLCRFGQFDAGHVCGRLVNLTRTGVGALGLKPDAETATVTCSVAYSSFAYLTASSALLYLVKGLIGNARGCLALMIACTAMAGPAIMIGPLSRPALWLGRQGADVKRHLALPFWLWLELAVGFTVP